MYFINSYYALPAIVTLPTSGASDRQQKAPKDLINSGLVRPTALTIDFNMAARLFWADELRNVIESCKPDGSDRTVMFTQNEGSLLTTLISQELLNAVATRIDFLVRGVVRRRRAFRGLKTSSEEVERSVHAHSFRFPRTRFFACQPKDAHQNLGRGNRTRRLTCRPTCIDFIVRKARITPRTRKSVRSATT